ncbi:MAG: tetratricopeptide repeat protein [Vicinamibacteria bacterium]
MADPVSPQSVRTAGTTKPSSSGTPMLIGAVTRADLEAAPFSEWFQSRHDDYRPAADTIAELKTRLADVSVEVYFGTWCGDSRRQVPHLLRILRDAGFDERRLGLYALSDLQMEFKQAPQHPEAKRRIHRTPTIVLVREGREIGRIVETPGTTLEADLLAIAKGQSAVPKFGAEARVNDLFIDTPSAKFESALKQAGPDIATRTNPDTLWHYAEFDLLRNGHPAEARAVLDVYLKDHPSSAQGHVLMAEALIALGRKKDAIDSVQRALAIEPKNDRALALAQNLRPPADR